MKVYLVGSGPGDPGLITVKGLDCIRRADVIIYDHLVSEELLKEAKEGVEIIYVGKEGNRHTLEQDEI
ncbi:MAG TPA: uroporphyrinogen-III C-methyltransferase, partial [Candidatus Hypogeohydataceae bacterium YC38]